MQRRFELLTKANVHLAFNFYANPQKCNANYFNEYIRYSALSDMEEGRAVTHTIIEYDENNCANAIIGYITLRNSSFVKDFDGQKIGYPSLEIYMLCVDKKYENSYIGTHLVAFSMNIAKFMSNKLSGVEYLLLCATDSSKGYYMRKEFGFAPTNELLPRCPDNQDCIPMYLKLKFQ